MLKSLLIIFSVLFSLSFSLPAKDFRLEIDLGREWLIEIGDDTRYAHPDFDDNEWEIINVPNRWENEGFPGYDGYAWFRVHFYVPTKLNQNHLYLNLGRIDDVDQTYLNGKLIGGIGEFPPNYRTAWDIKREYKIPKNLLKLGQDNILAVRVFDLHGSGGFISDQVGIYTRLDVLNLDFDLSGTWNFSTKEDSNWTSLNYNDSNWSKITVPDYWEKNGFQNHDGYGYYRKSFNLPTEAMNKKLILMLGKINDIDEVIFNGKAIGRTGDFPSKSGTGTQSYKDEERAYFIPPQYLKANGLNTIAVKVFDLGAQGGIYSGYIGIATREEYLKYTKKKNK